MEAATNSIIVAVIVAVLGLVGNITYFNYQQRREAKKEILQKRLIRLLMPLHILFENDDLAFSGEISSDNGDPFGYLAETPSRLRSKVIKIIEDNLYLADGELETGCLKFIEWAYSVSEQKIFEEAHVGKDSHLKYYEKFKKLVSRKYRLTKKEYLTSFGINT